MLPLTSSFAWGSPDFYTSTKLRILHVEMQETARQRYQCMGLPKSGLGLEALMLRRTMVLTTLHD